MLCDGGACSHRCAIIAQPRGFNHLGGIAGDGAALGDVLGDHRTGADKGITANGDARQKGRTDADESTGLQVTGAADMDTGSDGGEILGGHIMADGGVAVDQHEPADLAIGADDGAGIDEKAVAMAGRGRHGGLWVSTPSDAADQSIV